MSSARSLIFIKKYWKTKQLEQLSGDFQKHISLLLTIMKYPNRFKGRAQIVLHGWRQTGNHQVQNHYFNQNFFEKLSKQVNITDQIDENGSVRCEIPTK